MSTDNILDTIDGALEDWEVSRDAMRHIPEDERTEERRPPVTLQVPITPDAAPSWDRIRVTILGAYVEGHDLGRDER